VRGPSLQDRVVLGPRGRILAAGDGSPPRVRVREALAALIITHSPPTSETWQIGGINAAVTSQNGAL